MTKQMTGSLAAVALLFGTVSCAASGMAKDEGAAAVQDTTEVQNPPGYSGMERDTTRVPADSQPTAVDTFLNTQGTGVPTDTAGYSGMEHPDTSGMGGMDTSGMGGMDTTGMPGVDTTSQ